MYWFTADWSGYRQLHLDFFNPAESPLTLVVKVCDEVHRRSAMDYHDRFHYEVVVPGASNVHVEIDLKDVAAAPAERSMQMERVAMLDIFSVNATTPATFYMDNVRLVP